MKKSKLTLEQAEEIRSRYAPPYPDTIAVLADDYDVSPATIKAILNEQTFRREIKIELTREQYRVLNEVAKLEGTPLQEFVQKLLLKDF